MDLSCGLRFIATVLKIKLACSQHVLSFLPHNTHTHTVKCPGLQAFPPRTSPPCKVPETHGSSSATYILLLSTLLYIPTLKPWWLLLYCSSFMWTSPVWPTKISLPCWFHSSCHYRWWASNFVSDVVVFSLNLLPSCFSTQIIVELGWKFSSLIFIIF